MFIFDSMVLTETIGTSEFVQCQVMGRKVVRHHTKIPQKLREYDQQWRLSSKYLSYKCIDYLLYFKKHIQLPIIIEKYAFIIVNLSSYLLHPNILL